MATSEDGHDRPNPHTKVVDEFRKHRDHTASRRTLEYLQGQRRADDLSMQQDIVPALKRVGGTVALRYRFERKTEHVYPTGKSTDMVASCYFDNGQELHSNVPFTRDELDAFRGIPEPDDFVHETTVTDPKPVDALPDRGDA